MIDLARIRSELASLPPLQPLPFDLAVAVFCDRARAAGQIPDREDAWIALGAGVAARKGTPTDQREGQLGLLAALLADTSLGAAAVEALGRLRGGLLGRLEAMLVAVAPLTVELVVDNAFRREELVRRFAEALDAPIAGESPKESARRLAQLDYRSTLAEVERADKARKSEAERRAKALKAAQEKAAAEAAAQGWRE